jgi:hypothetical protein
MNFYQVDPIRDGRWTEFAARHPKASIFHAAGWLDALQRTYGYRPVGFTNSPPTGELTNGLVCCEVDSWMTGSRLVSLPFSDHCEPLVDSVEELGYLIRALQERVKTESLRYIEVRPTEWDLGELSAGTEFHPSARYFWHVLDMQGDLDEVFGNLDKDSVQRRIRHAERSGVTDRCGSSEDLLKQFYDLFVLTRGRHQLPPMPYLWFQNLLRSLNDSLEIRVAYAEAKPVAGILTLRFRNLLHYKYGCSNIRFKNLGAMPWLLWRAISGGKKSGATKFDMGRTEEDNPGLLTFKNHWVSQPGHLVYWKYPQVSSIDGVDSRRLKLAKRVFSHMPHSLLKLTGKLIYKHIG